MFTGLVEEIGVVAELNPHDKTGGTSLIIALPQNSPLLADAQLGDSIAVNGVCLTATSITINPPSGLRPSFTVGIAPETLRLTNLGSLAKNSPVNLERAVRADTRMGGHFVQGHVDTVAAITAMRPDGNAVTMRLAPRPSTPAENTAGSSGAQSQEVPVAPHMDAMRYIVYKGFIALDGTSLTVTRVDDEEGWFEVMLIAYTQEKVVLAGKRVGDLVNIEVDVLAKYAEKSMAGYLGAQGNAAIQPIVEKLVQNLVMQAMGGHTA